MRPEGVALAVGCAEEVPLARYRLAAAIAPPMSRRAAGIARRMSGCAAGVALLIAGCAAPDDPTEGAHARMAWDPSDFWSAPWPSSVRGAGVGDFPNPDGIGFVSGLLAASTGLTGAGTTAGVFFPLEAGADPASLPDLRGSMAPGAAWIVGVEPGSPDDGVRVPVHADLREDGGPFGTSDLLALVPLQGRPLRPGERYVAAVTRALTDWSGRPFGASPALQDPEDPELAAAVEALEARGVDRASLVAVAPFRTQDPTAELRAVLDDARGRLEPIGAWTPAEVYDDYCVFEARVSLPVYQTGTPPYDDGGGTFREDGALVRREEARVLLTVPSTATPAGGWPTVVFVRTGAGGDRPLVDRGVRDSEGVATAGTGYAVDFASAGFAGISVDGPLGGIRNPTGGDEQFLVFNVLNPGAMRDNVRQSALELALIPDLLDGLGAVPGCLGDTALDTDRLALFGHSMGATIGPLTLALQPRFGAAILSGAGGSWIHNVVHKLSPLEVRPLAEAMLRYPARRAELHEADPVLSLLQWAGESADPPAWGAAVGTEAILMLQGIVDTYILPPMANATSLSLGLDLAGPARDDDPRLDAFERLPDLLDLGGGGVPVALPAPRPRAVVQLDEDGVEDGHEVAFQREDARALVRCFLASFAADAPRIGCEGS